MTDEQNIAATDMPSEDFPELEAAMPTEDESSATGEQPVLKFRQRREEAPPENSSLTADDTDAESDLSRPSRAVQFRIQRRSQVSTALPALLMIALGLLYLIRPAMLTRPLGIGLAVGAIAISLVMRFLLNTRRERGLFFVGVLLMLWGGIAAAAATNLLNPLEMWPLVIVAFGIAMILTFIFERTHDRGLLFPGMILIAAGGIALPFTMDYFSSSAFSGIALYWPVFFLIIALALLPRVVRDRAD